MRSLLAPMAPLALLALVACGDSNDNNNPDVTSDAGNDTTDTTQCTAGELGCECAEGDTCSGELECEAGVCRDPEVPIPGELNAPCGDDDACGIHGGAQLACIEGSCQVPDCLSGATTCPCGPSDACDEAGATCEEGVCVLEGCEPGTAGCECGAGDTCEGDLACVAGTCQTGVTSGVIVGEASVRACEVAFQDDGTLLANLTFDETVRGQFARRGDTVAAVFFAVGDASITDGAINVTLASSDASALDGLTTLSVACFDNVGAPVAEPGFEVR